MTIKGPVACSFDFDVESETALRQAHELALRLDCEQAEQEQDIGQLLRGERLRVHARIIDTGASPGHRDSQGNR